MTVKDRLAKYAESPFLFMSVFVTAISLVFLVIGLFGPVSVVDREIALHVGIGLASVGVTWAIIGAIKAFVDVLSDCEA